MKKATILFLLLVFSTVFAQRRVSEEAKMFNQTKDNVFTVFGNEHGSGFLFDKINGLILTNEHVISNSQNISVQIDDNQRINAKLIEKDKRKDLAVLAIHPDFVKNLEGLLIAVASDTMIYVGERVIAIGSPLNQTRTLTSGIVSNIERETIISDVNINPGNSGGPLINMIGQVVGINTFGDFSSVGPGLSGSVIITEANEIISNAVAAVSQRNLTLSKKLLPIMPKDRFPLDALETAALNEFHDKDYQLKAGKFKITFITPPYQYNAQKAKSLRMSSKREGASSGSDESEEVFSDLKNWTSSVGKFKPVVSILIEPTTGETSASATANACGAAAAGYAGTSYYGHHTYEFKSDVENFTLKRDGKVIEPIINSFQYITLDFKSAGYYGSYSGEDLAQAGYFVYPIDAFLPTGGSFPEFSFDVVNHMDNQTITHLIPENSIYKINADFEPYTNDNTGSLAYKKPSGGDGGLVCVLLLLGGLFLMAAGA